MSTTVRAPAKINLHLGVGPLGEDGFHPLATLYQAVGLYDDVTVSDQLEWSVHLRGDGRIDLDEVPADDRNIALRAGRALVAHHGLERAAKVEIRKGIPVAGGMAGGSADAAATLVALDRLWDLQTPDDDLLRLAAGLGSDVPFALLGGTAIGSGHGELVTPVVDHGSWWWVVVENDTGLATPDVYRAFDELHAGALLPTPQIPPALHDALLTGDVEQLARLLRNDLQEPALRLRPDLAATFDDALAAGAHAALLSGSGPSVLLLCGDRAQAEAVDADLAGRGHGRTSVVPAPVAGAHVVEYV
ncbi:4-diphosphocytidyl-2-C-methyl-D-erythritol kinase [Nocardioides sp. OK12]|uniref:4-diphosphocytidyl-2-C-methyl-D-erythritol kinase n=1 Tax=Nocardioides marinisabuli TaxID=419476 RepID=A0A7Y9F156_9ACTN|nr:MULTISPECIES: 4-(cytidine 5'-diphospho)-2-C-methyl-D-erythritol kinase [Nocardioides]NYD57705.1 4-diphosphocytidyl-2-C-methyl-D-erythritol kinase [Nocardioides marinisabuli]GHJ58796.1 4-diphosphocytidyl-2-C-methyl-D-erythritol kinase [Nocardioides sp. OK12]